VIIRETLSATDERLKREGRMEQAHAFKAELMAKGMIAQVAQQRMVEAFQPLDGTQAKSWAPPSQGGKKAAIEADKKAGDRVGNKRIDFSRMVMWAFRKLPGGGRRALKDYAQKSPDRFIEEFVKPIAIKQIAQPKDDIKKPEDDTTSEGQLDEFMKTWLKPMEKQDGAVGS
jgi:hypothetical protein